MGERNPATQSQGIAGSLVVNVIWRADASSFLMYAEFFFYALVAGTIMGT
jgi:hypothetical protein